jgi:phosphoglycolate phosphatase
MSTPITTLVFDLDGTLVDTIEDIRGALNAALTAFGKPAISTPEVIGMIGGGVDDMLSDAIGDAPIVFDDFKSHYRHHYRDNIDKFTAPYTGIPSLLHTLHTAGIQMAILTNKQTEPAKRLMTLFGFTSYFQIIAGPDHYGVPKPDPAGLLQLMADLGTTPDATLFIGDSEPDIQVAAGAGIRCVAVGYGYRESAVLASLHPWRLVPDVPTLQRLLLTEIQQA